MAGQGVARHGQGLVYRPAGGHAPRQIWKLNAVVRSRIAADIGDIAIDHASVCSEGCRWVASWALLINNRFNSLAVIPAQALGYVYIFPFFFKGLVFLSSWPGQARA
jgi:hypothetical protein